MNVLGPNLNAEIIVTPNVSVDNVEYNKYPRLDISLNPNRHDGIVSFNPEIVIRPNT